MCDFNYFTKEDVQQVADTIGSISQGDLDFASVRDLLEKLSPTAALAGIAAALDTGNPVQAFAGLFAAGVEFGITLAGARDRIPPVSDERAAKVKAKLADWQNAKEAASILADVLQAAAAA